jgi:cytochrome c-type biogenesis protein CcmF
MLAEIGLITTALAFVAALYAIGASVLGAWRHSERLVESARNAGLLTFPLMVLANGALLAALLTEQYNISYVWSVTDPQTPVFYRITALWGSQAGSLLFWNLIMSGFAAAALALNWRTNHRLMPYAIPYSMATLAFFLGLSVFLENPFTRYWVATDGQIIEAAFRPAGAIVPPTAMLAESANGLNPLLRHFGMIIHPPMLYLGFTGFLIPFAYAMAALASGDLTTNWIKATRRWALVAWLFLSLGLILGGRWAYDVLGWGGYWGWDPVENAAFLPWLIGTAFIHSVMIQEKRGMLKVWNMFLVLFTFSAVIFGTFATRSGLVESVHSFAESEIGFPMFVFWAAVTVVSVGLLLWRWGRGELRDEHQFVGLLSRETLFVLNNVIFVALFIAIFWGSFGAPIISELFMGTEITLGVDYFNAVTPPLFAAMFVLMGVAPLSAWTANSVGRLGRGLVVPLLITLAFVGAIYLTGVISRGNPYAESPGAIVGYAIVSLAGAVALYEIYRGAKARRASMGESWGRAVSALFARNRRRYGGYIVHLGITIIGIGVVGSTIFQQETRQTLAAGESLTLNGYTLTYDGFVDAIADDGRHMLIANTSVARGDAMLAQLRPRQDLYPDMPMTIAGAYSPFPGFDDFYVLLTGIQADGSATFKVYYNPLINMVWWGGLVLIVGTFLAAWKTEPHPAQARKPAPKAVEARATL